MGTTIITILKTTKGRHWEISNLPRKPQILDGYWLNILLSVIIYLLNWQKCKGFSSKHEWLTVSMLLWWSAQKCLSKETRKWRLIYISTTINSYFQKYLSTTFAFLDWLLYLPMIPYSATFVSSVLFAVGRLTKITVPVLSLGAIYRLLRFHFPQSHIFFYSSLSALFLTINVSPLLMI